MQETTPQPVPQAPVPRQRTFDESPALAAQAAAMLGRPRAGQPMAADEVRHVLGQMRLVSFARGTTLFREGDGSHSTHMLLLLEGEVEVDAGISSAADAVAISVLGPGSVIGEMALLDGAPRSANCTAVSTVLAAALSRQGLETLIEQHPRAAAKLLVVLAQASIERLRAMSQQLHVYAHLNDKLRAELQAQRPR